MSYCRGWIYVIHSGDNLVCMSQLHLNSEQFMTTSRDAMRRHLLEHQEDADEISTSIAKAYRRLSEEIEKQGDILEPLSGER